MNILVLASTFPRFPGDKQPDFVLNLSLELAKRHHVIVLAPHDKHAKIHEHMGPLDVWRFPYFVPSGEILAYRGGILNALRSNLLARLELPLFLAFEYFFTVYLLWRYHIGLIHVHWLPNGLIASWAKLLRPKTKILITTHGGDVAFLQNNLVKLCAPAIVSAAGHITFVSSVHRQRARALLGEHIPATSIIPMGVRMPDSPPALESGSGLLFIGRLVEIKGLPTILEALKLLRTDLPNLTLTVLGDGPMRHQWEVQARNMGVAHNVHFAGYVVGPEKDRYLAGARYIIVSSIKDRHGHEEGLPVVALEALSTGKILIATRTGGLPDLISGGNGVLIEPGDAPALAAAILRLEHAPGQAAEIQRRALAAARDYSWDAIGQKFLTLIGKL